MKKSILIFVVSVLLVSVVSQAQNLPYKVEYSSSFKIASHDLSKMILELYKGYEANDFSKEAWFADTVIALLPNGQVVRGKAEVLRVFKEDRQNAGDAKFTMGAVIPLTSTDRNDNWVALWGTTETSQGKNDFQAIWRINKDKKVDYIRFYNAAPSQE
jgi:hypothetical protein